jgi:hypothetical protein
MKNKQLSQGAIEPLSQITYVQPIVSVLLKSEINGEKSENGDQKLEADE